MPPTPVMNIFQVSLNRCGAGVGILSSDIFLTLDFGGLFLLTITFSKDGHAMTFVQYVSETQIDWSIPIFSPYSVLIIVSPGQPVFFVHSRQFSPTSCDMLTNVFFFTKT